LIATGGTAIASIELVDQLGANLIECAFVIGLPDLGGVTRILESGFACHVMTEFEGD